MKRKLIVVMLCLITCMTLLGACSKNQVVEDVTTVDNTETEDLSGLSPDSLWNRDINNLNCLNMKMDVDECELTMDGEQVSLLTTKNADGEPIRVKCENVRLSDDGTGLLLTEDSKIYLLDAIPGIKKMDIDCDIFDGDAMYIYGAFSITGRTSIDDFKQLTLESGTYIDAYEPKEDSSRALPNYLYIYMTGLGEIKLSQLDIYYTGNYTTISNYYMNVDRYRYYVEGEKYDSTKEQFDKDKGIYDFYINAVIDSPYINHNNSLLDIYGISDFEVGNMHRADGSIKSKDEPLEVGDFIDFTYDGMTFNIDSFVLKKSHAHTYYEALKDAVTNSKGQMHIVVLPILFSDQNWTQEDEEELKAALGRVLEADGTVVEYEGYPGCETVSSYFDKASYGCLNIDSTIVSPFEFKNVFGDFYTYDYGRENVVDEYLMNKFADWLSVKMDDFSLYDQDGNGIIDGLIVFNPGDLAEYDTFDRVTMSNAVAYKQYMGPELARFNGNIGVNNLVFCNFGALHKNNIRGVDDYDISVLIHELSHMLGLVDYYDVLHSSISPLGNFDMQASNKGDWNAFSKYAVGWITPHIVLPSEIDKEGSIEITIDAFEKNGDCIVIPTIKSELSNMSDTPFSEYMLVDLFTDEGLYSHDADEFDLGGVSAVRIYHVDGTLEERDLCTPTGIKYTIGTNHTSNSYNEKGHYMITLISASGRHNLIEYQAYDWNVRPSDFFSEGDSFSVEKYGYFFRNGKMYDESEFPYTITVKSIKDGKAVIEISK